jgi:hypothetical protein
MGRGGEAAAGHESRTNSGSCRLPTALQPYSAIAQSAYRISIRKLCSAVRLQLPSNLVSIYKIQIVVYTITSIDVQGEAEQIMQF